MNREAILAVYANLHECAAKIVATGEQHEPWLIPVVDGHPIEPMHLGKVPKDKWRQIQQAAAQALGDDVYTVLITEAWVSTSARFPIDMDALPTPSQDPKRREAVMFSFIGEGWQALSMCLIDRSTKTLERAALQFMGDPNVYFDGRMVVPSKNKGSIH